MINRNEALTITEADILLADERKDCIDAVVKRVNQIYDELESRSCETCKFNIAQDNYMIFCDSKMHQDGSKMMWHSFTKDFCCNKWEPKQ